VLTECSKDLNRSMVTMVKTPCGYIADAPTDILHVTHKISAAKIRIAEETSVENVCADEYVADKSMNFLSIR